MADFSNLEMTGRTKYLNEGYAGQGVIIAVIDGGCNPHNQLKGRMLAGKTFIKDEMLPGCIDQSGHGTHCAGLIAGTTCGVAPKAQILPLKVSGSIGFLNAIDYAIAQRVDIISISLTTAWNAKIKDAIQRAHKANITVVCASGNYGKNSPPRLPAALEDPIVIASCDRNKKLSDSSSHRKEVDFTQVGVKIFSYSYKDLKSYSLKSGTSMATPIVAGMCALIISKIVALTGKKPTEDEVFSILLAASEDKGLKGRDEQYGYGFVRF